MLETHCKAAFMKQVLPRLFNPVAPGSVGTIQQKTNSTFSNSFSYATYNIQATGPPKFFFSFSVFDIITDVAKCFSKLYHGIRF